MNLIYNLSLNANMLLSSQNNGGIKEELKDKFRALFPTWPYVFGYYNCICFSCCNFMILAS
nr:hypothetical protein [Mycoplasmopsis bovis]